MRSVGKWWEIESNCEIKRGDISQIKRMTKGGLNREAGFERKDNGRIPAGLRDGEEEDFGS